MSSKVEPLCICGHSEALHREGKRCVLFQASKTTEGGLTITGCPCMEFRPPLPSPRAVEEMGRTISEALAKGIVRDVDRTIGPKLLGPGL